MSHASAAVWHYIGPAGQAGPVSAEQMAALARAGTIRPDTMVWTAGMAGWAPFAQTPLAHGMGGRMSSPGLFGGGLAPAGAAAMAGPDDTDSFAGAVRACFMRYATFAGRARRPEFWWFMLFGIIGGVATGLVDMILFGMDGGPVNRLFHLVLLVPALAVGARRLHDTDRSGWWQLLWLVPVLGWILLIVFWCQRGTQGANRFG
jgi:uncharacterized membrane protein YhaH (DUF805 family)